MGAALCPQEGPLVLSHSLFLKPLPFAMSNTVLQM
jgi:hypothetical protein